MARLAWLWFVAGLVSCSPAPNPVAVPQAATTTSAVVSPPPPALPASVDAPIEVAITIDDLPHHGPDMPGVSRLEIHRRILDVLGKHHTPPVHGFVNGHWLEKHPEEREALALWVKSGHPLGNHSYSHPDLFSKLTESEYLADVRKNEPVLESLMGTSPDRVRAWKVFRYPYLREGKDLASRERIRTELVAAGYRLAPVSIDFFDWAYQPAYARCAAKNDAESIATLRTDYIDQAAFALRWSDAAARELVQRPVKQILLLHVGQFTSLMLDELLTTYEKNGAKFIELDVALADAIYREEPREPKVTFGNHLNQLRKARGTRTPAMAPPPDTLLERICR